MPITQYFVRSHHEHCIHQPPSEAQSVLRPPCRRAKFFSYKGLLYECEAEKQSTLQHPSDEIDIEKYVWPWSSPSHQALTSSKAAIMAKANLYIAEISTRCVLFLKCKSIKSCAITQRFLLLLPVDFIEVKIPCVCSRWEHKSTRVSM